MDYYNQLFLSWQRRSVNPHYVLPSILSVTGTVTDALLSPQLYCFGAEVSENNKNWDLTIDTVRGTLPKLTMIFYSSYV